MWPYRVSNPGPLAHESDVLSTALRGPAIVFDSQLYLTYRVIDSAVTDKPTRFALCLLSLRVRNGSAVDLEPSFPYIMHMKQRLIKVSE